MEGKAVIMSVVLVSLVVVLGQIQVEAQEEGCCPNASARNIYRVCRFADGPKSFCASTSGCSVTSCPPGWKFDMLQNTSANEYCKSGCVSSVCAAITTLQNSDASEVVKGAVEKCRNACSDYCTKGSAVITTA